MFRRAAFLVLALMAAAQAADQPPLPTLAVVLQWRDLLAQPRIDIGGGVTVRLGVEAGRCTNGMGVLVYCLAEGFTPPTSGHGEDHLGPLRIRVARDGKEDGEEMSSWERQSAEHPNGLPLYGRMVIVPTSVACTATVSTADGRRLATATIPDATQQPASWTYPGAPGGIAQAELGDDRDLVLGGMGFGAAIRATPTCDGLTPLAWYEPTNHQEDQPLPKLVPTSADPRFRLGRERDALTMTSDLPLLFCGDSVPFLLRWSVNDLPCQPAGRPTTIDHGGRCFEGVRSVRLAEFDLKGLGAKRGDRIGVQALLCPYGWAPGGDGDATKTLLPVLSAAALMPAMLSNRVDFVMP